MQINGDKTIGNQTLRRIFHEMYEDTKFRFYKISPHPSVAEELVKGIQWLDKHAVQPAVSRHRVEIVRKDARIGDWIFRLPNCPLPLILRPRGSFYNFIGGVYRPTRLVDAERVFLDPSFSGEKEQNCCHLLKNAVVRSFSLQQRLGASQDASANEPMIEEAARARPMNMTRY